MGRKKISRKVSGLWQKASIKKKSHIQEHKAVIVPPLPDSESEDEEDVLSPVSVGGRSDLEGDIEKAMMMTRALAKGGKPKKTDYESEDSLTSDSENDDANIEALEKEELRLKIESEDSVYGVVPEDQPLHAGMNFPKGHDEGSLGILQAGDEDPLSLR